MAKEFKRPKGLSKREVKRAAAAKSLVKPKVSTRATASKAKAPLVGAGPLMTGQTRVGGTVTGAGPLLAGQSRDNSYNGDLAQKRAQAAKAQQSKSKPKTSLIDRASDLAGTVGAKLRNVPGLKQIAGYGDDYVDTGNKKSLGKVLAPFAVGAAIPAGMFVAGAGAAGGLSSLAGVGRGVVGRGGNLFKSGVKNFGDDVVSKMPSSAIPIAGVLGASSPSFVPSVGTMIADTPFSGSDDTADDGIMDETPFRRPQQINVDESLTDDQRDSRKKYSRDDGSDSSLSDEMNIGETAFDAAERQRQLNNELYGGGTQSDLPGSTTGNRSGRGMGYFGTGKGTSGNPLLDEYQQQLKGFKKQGNKMEDLYDDMIKALDPTYDSYKQDIQKSVDEELRRNLLNLSSTMIANNTLDSEQRAQLMSQQQGQSQANLGDLLRKLMLQKQEEVSGIREKKAGALERLGDRQMSTREKMAQLMSQLQESPRGSGRAVKGEASGNRDAAFEKQAKSLVQQVLMGRMNRDAAARNLSSFFPDYDENVIYDLLPDNYNR